MPARVKMVILKNRHLEGKLFIILSQQPHATIITTTVRNLLLTPSAHTCFYLSCWSRNKASILYLTIQTSEWQTADQNDDFSLRDCYENAGDKFQQGVTKFTGPMGVDQIFQSWGWGLEQILCHWGDKTNLQPPEVKGWRFSNHDSPRWR